jgi:hypothetical protein
MRNIGNLLLLTFVEWVCVNYRVSVTSWWRSARRNLEKGGQTTSRHLVGGAVDLVYDADEKKPELEFLQAIAKPFFVRVIREEDHDHCQTEMASPAAIIAAELAMKGSEIQLKGKKA